MGASLSGALWILAGASALSCLPADTRPPPAVLTLSVTADESVPFTTVDGWTLTVERLVVGVGNAWLEGPCSQYGQGRYDRLLDVRAPGEQKLSVLFGLGRCVLRFRLAGPSVETLVGVGVSDLDKIAMGIPAANPFTTTPETVSVDFAATAQRGAESARMHWRMRQLVRYRHCGVPRSASELPTPIEFASARHESLHLTFRPEELFLDDATAGQLRFDPLAAADQRFGDADGEITLEELASEPIEFARAVGKYERPPIAEGAVSRALGADPRPIRSLGQYVTWVLLPRIAQFQEPIVCVPTLPEVESEL